MEDMKFEDFEKEETKKPSETLGIIGFVFSLIGLLTSCCYGIGLVLAVPGLVLSAIQTKKNRTSLGIAGLVLGIIGVIIGFLMVIFFITVFNSSEFQELYNSILESQGAI